MIKALRGPTAERAQTSMAWAAAAYSRHGGLDSAAAVFVADPAESSTVSAAQQQPGQAGRPGGRAPLRAGRSLLRARRPSPRAGRSLPRAGQAATASPAAGAVKPDVYRSPVSLVVWWVWVAFAAANLIDLAVQGHDHFALVVAAVLVMITGVTYVTAFRPKVTADDAGLTITNPLRDHRVPWICVESLDLGDSLEIRCQWQDDGPRRRKLYGWAVHSPRRSRLKTQMRAKRKISAAERRSESFSRMPPEAREAMAKTAAEHIVESLRARAARAGTPIPPATEVTSAPVDGPVSRWDLLALAALLVPAALLAAAALT